MAVPVDHDESRAICPVCEVVSASEQERLEALSESHALICVRDNFESISAVSPAKKKLREMFSDLAELKR